MDSFLKRVSEVQDVLKAPKSQTNSFGGYKYRSCEDILTAAKPILKEKGLVLNLSDRVNQMGDRWYVEATATLYDTESDAKIISTASAREAASKKGMDDSQITGTASSYARKYALNGLFNIDDTKDSDTDEYRKDIDKRAEQAADEAKWREKAAKEKAQLDEEAKLAAEGAILCSVCGKPIKPVRTDGNLYTVKDIADNTRNTYGKVMCWICAAEAKKASNA